MTKTARRSCWKNMLRLMLTLCNWDGSIFTTSPKISDFTIIRTRSVEKIKKKNIKNIGDQLCGVILSIRTAINTPLDLKLDTNILSIRSKRQFFHDYLHFLIVLVATYNPFRTIVHLPSHRALRESTGHDN